MEKKNCIKSQSEPWKRSNNLNHTSDSMNFSEKKSRETEFNELGNNEKSKKNNKIDNIDRVVVYYDDSSISYSKLKRNEQETTLIDCKRNVKNVLDHEDSVHKDDSFTSRLRSLSWGSCLRHELEEFENAEKIILDVVDRFEDELDTHIALPFKVRLFFEDDIFGWDHLSSDIAGSLFYPLLVSIVQYYIFYFLWENHGFSTFILDWVCSSTIQHSKNGIYYVMCNISETWAQFITHHQYKVKCTKITYSIIAALVTFRAIRRRRKVWFRSTYGSKDYLQDIEKRREEISEVDKKTLLGKIRQNVQKRKDQILANRVRRKLMKASNRFERKASRTNLLELDSNSTTTVSKKKPTIDAESVAHDQLYLSECIKKIPYAHGGYFGAAPFMLADPIWVDVLRTLMPNVYVEVAKRIFAPAAKLIHWGENNPVVAAYGTAQELEYRDSEGKNKGITLEWDVFLDPVLVKKLEATINERKKFLDKHQLHEYPPFRESCQKKNMACFDESIKRQTRLLLDTMLIAHGTLSQLILEQTGLCKNYVYSRVRRTCKTLGGGIFASQWLAVYAEALRMGIIGKKNSLSPIPGSHLSTSPMDSTTFLSSSSCNFDQNDEDLILQDLSDTLSNSSSSFDTLINEEHDLTQNNNPLSHFLSAHTFESSVNDYYESSGCTSATSHPSSPILINAHSTSLDALAISSCPTYSISESIEIIDSILGGNMNDNNESQSLQQPQLGLILDLKSRHVSKQVWALIVDVLRQSNIRVEGVASFVPEEIRGISNHTLNSVDEILFCHSAGDLQHLCHTGQIKQNDTIYFNAGSLIWDSTESGISGLLKDASKKCVLPFDADLKKESYRLQPYAVCTNACENIDMSVRSTIQAYKEKFNLQIGLYCQEFAIDDAAVDFLVSHINKFSQIYNLGLSWGGLNGVTVANIQPGRFTNTDGLWNQRYVGKRWNSNLIPKMLK